MDFVIDSLDFWGYLFIFIFYIYITIGKLKVALQAEKKKSRLRYNHCLGIISVDGKNPPTLEDQRFMQLFSFKILVYLTPMEKISGSAARGSYLIDKDLELHTLSI